MEKYYRAGQTSVTIWRMRVACWMPKATNTHSEYVILIAFPLQQWLQDSASLLRHNTLPVLFKDFLVGLESSSSVQGTGHRAQGTGHRARIVYNTTIAGAGRC